MSIAYLCSLFLGDMPQRFSSDSHLRGTISLIAESYLPSAVDDGLSEFMSMTYSFGFSPSMWDERLPVL